jgi:hypothetical protein
MLHMCCRTLSLLLRNLCTVNISLLHFLSCLYCGPLPVLLCSAGAGGDEAGIWAGDLLRMYQRYAQSQGWKASMINYTEADAGGYKEAVLQVCRAFPFVEGAGCWRLRRAARSTKLRPRRCWRLQRSSAAGMHWPRLAVVKL